MGAASEHEDTTPRYRCATVLGRIQPPRGLAYSPNMQMGAPPIGSAPTY